jgi:low affinity Fe/Cu permease
MTETILFFCAMLGAVGFVVSLICVAMIAGFLRSTHTVQYIPQEVPAGPLKPWSDEEELEKLKESVGKKKVDPIADEIDSAMEEITKSDVLF